MKFCPKCNSEKTLSQFATNPARHDGLSSYCRPCARQYYKENKEARLTQKKEYWIRNKETLKPKRKAHYEKVKHQVALKRGTPEYRARERDLRMQREFGINLETVEKMKAEQNSQCGICEISFNEPKVVMCVDHDHRTGAVRKLLCRKCNAALGLFRDELKIISNALEYLKEHK